MAINSQARKYQLTINKPTKHGISDQLIRNVLESLLSIEYYCMSREIGRIEKTEHMHIFLYSDAPIRFSTLKNKFPTAHIEKAYGSVQENRDYVAKRGKWSKSEKADTSIEGSFHEWGHVPSEGKELAPQQDELIQLINEGKTTAEIIRQNPKFIFRSRDIDTLREVFLSEKYSKEMRNVKVEYIFGKTGVGKSKSIYDRHDAVDVCRITNYSGSGVRFDAYHAHPVLVFEEYNGQIPISDMLCYLDRYPVQLPARYSDRTACFKKVYIVSNLDLKYQYLYVQEKNPDIWNAFLRRIKTIKEIKKDGSIIKHLTEEYKNEI